MTASPTARNSLGARSISLASPRTKYSGCVLSQGWSGATWFGTKSTISRSTTVGERPAGNCQSWRAAEQRVDVVAGDAVGGADDVVGGEVGECGVEVGEV